MTGLMKQLLRKAGYEAGVILAAAVFVHFTGITL